MSRCQSEGRHCGQRRTGSSSAAWHAFDVLQALPPTHHDQEEEEYRGSDDGQADCIISLGVGEVGGRRGAMGWVARNWGCAREHSGVLASVAVSSTVQQQRAEINTTVKLSRRKGNHPPPVAQAPFDRQRLGRHRQPALSGCSDSLASVSVPADRMESPTPPAPAPTGPGPMPAGIGVDILGFCAAGAASEVATR